MHTCKCNLKNKPYHAKTLTEPIDLGCIRALRGNDSAGSVFAQRHLTKLILDRLLRQCNGLMVYNKIEQVLVISKQIFNYYNNNFSRNNIKSASKVN